MHETSFSSDRQDAAESASALIVEDDNSIALLLRFILERDGFQVTHAADGREAQRQIAQMVPPTIVILDVMLPYVDGYELLAGIRARADWKSVPVVMLTTKGREVDIAHAFDTGADDYVVKPFQPEELRARLRRLLRRDK